MTPHTNCLIGQLLPADQSLLIHRCEEVWVEVGNVLLSPQTEEQFVYFLGSSSVAMVVRSANGSGLALGLIGPEGAVGLQLGLGMGPGVMTYQAQSSGVAWRVAAPVLQQLVQKRAALLLACAKYLWVVSQEVASMATSAQTQDIRARLATWILLSTARSGPATLMLTQAHLADMLGVRRASITLAAMELKARGLLEYRRGKVFVLDPVGLEAVARTTHGSAVVSAPRAR